MVILDQLIKKSLVQHQLVLYCSTDNILITLGDTRLVKDLRDMLQFYLY